MAKEAIARIKINRLLEEAGWRFFDNEKGAANIELENSVKISRTSLDEFGENFENTAKGYIDFLLLDENKFPLIVLEAKSEDKDPLAGKEQARLYAQGKIVRFVILSNGNLHYFWDIETGNPEIITAFPTLESIEHRKQFRPNPKNLYNEPVDRDYILLTQKPDYAQDPRWNDEKQRAAFLKNNNL